jgi:hypothetical protein
LALLTSLKILVHFAMETYLRLRSVEHRAPTLSPDGYIRLPLASLSSLSFVHLYSDSDDVFLDELKSHTIPARSAGFTEWKSDAAPSISLGWGWFIHSQTERMMLAPDGVRSNVMLIDAHGYDLGPIKTSNLFCTWLAAFEWQDIVDMAVRGTVAC